MILPTTYSATLLLLILSMICWGSWANTLKLTGPRWRFELFYFDYSFGVLVASVIAAFTFGLMGAELNFQDRMLVAGHLKEMYVFAGGVVFNLANMLLVGAIALAGMAVAFPVGIGLALIIGVVWNYILDPQGNPVLLFAGLALVICAVIVDAVAHRARDRAITAAAAPSSKKPKKSTTTKGLVISIISGVLMGTFYPLVEKGMGGEMGLGP
jgi:glucose uptake protein